MTEATNPMDRAMAKAAKAAYEPPVLRVHGALHDVTSGPVAGPSGHLSDVNLKENIVAVSWA